MFLITTERQVKCLAIAITFTIVPTVAVGLRIWSRNLQKLPLAPNDYCMFAALIAAYSVTACELTNVLGGGVGLHEDYVFETSPSSLYMFGKSMLAIQLTWAVAQGLVKSSMCLLYISIFSMKAFRISAYVIMGVCNAFALMVIMATLLICTPLSMQWDPAVQGTCGNRNVLWLVVGILNIITDTLVVALPMPMLWHLQIPKAKRYALLAIFSLGSFVCVVSMVRLKFLLDVDFTGDTTWTVVDATVWSLLEPTLGVTVGCLPTLGPLFTRIVPRRLLRSARGTRGSTKGTADDATFKRLDEHSYPLTTSTKRASAAVNYYEVSSNVEKHTRMGSEADSLAGREGINVTTEWQVHRH